MKNFLLIIFIFLSSCCIFTSKDCDCKTSKPFLIEGTKEWINFSTDQITFSRADSLNIQKIVQRKYYGGDECIGGDECCTNYPYHSSTYFLPYHSNSFLYVKAIKNYVEFSVDTEKFNQGLGVTGEIFLEINVDNNVLSTASLVNVFENDTLINGQIFKKLYCQNKETSHYTIFFKDIEYLKGLGLVAFTDTFGVKWIK